MQTIRKPSPADESLFDACITSAREYGYGGAGAVELIVGGLVEDGWAEAEAIAMARERVAAAGLKVETGH